MNFASNRWVLLHHQVGGQLGDRGDHFDLMLSPVDVSHDGSGLEASGLEEVGCLWTWAIPTNPLDQTLPLECSAKRLPDHRAAYLEYEGPIAGNRGEVRQVASGNYEVISLSEDLIELRMQCCDAVVGRYEGQFSASLKRRGEDWSLRWSAFR